jgi:hypothetical protein
MRHFALYFAKAFQFDYQFSWSPQFGYEPVECGTNDDPNGQVHNVPS